MLKGDPARLPEWVEHQPDWVPYNYPTGPEVDGVAPTAPGYLCVHETRWGHCGSTWMVQEPSAHGYILADAMTVLRTDHRAGTVVL